MMWLTTKEAAQLAKRSTRYLLDAARTGELVGHQARAPHGSWRFKESDVEKWLTGS